MNKALLCSASLLVLLLSPSLLAQPPLPEALEQCRNEQNSIKRLACYDKISTSDTTPAEPANPTRNNPRASVAQDFGREHRQKADYTADQIYAVVSRISFSPRKLLIIEFDNGQVWRQTDSATYQVNVGERHFIKRGMLGAFYLGNDNNNRTLKVKRED